MAAKPCGIVESECTEETRKVCRWELKAQLLAMYNSVDLANMKIVTPQDLGSFGALVDHSIQNAKVLAGRVRCLASKKN